jgi:putative transcriptional regulator
MPTFAEKLKQLRESAGLTQAGLAQKTGLSLGVVRDYEQGRKEPAMRSAFKLAEALGVSCEAFKDCIAEEAPAPKKPTRKRKGN